MLIETLFCVFHLNVKSSLPMWSLWSVNLGKYIEVKIPGIFIGSYWSISISSFLESISLLQLHSSTFLDKNIFKFYKSA